MALLVLSKWCCLVIATLACSLPSWYRPPSSSLPMMAVLHLLKHAVRCSLGCKTKDERVASRLTNYQLR